MAGAERRGHVGRQPSPPQAHFPHPTPTAVVDVHQNWCGPCSVMEPILRKIKLEHENVQVRFYTVSRWEGEGMRMGKGSPKRGQRARQVKGGGPRVCMCVCCVSVQAEATRSLCATAAQPPTQPSSDPPHLLSAPSLSLPFSPSPSHFLSNTCPHQPTVG